MTFGANYRYLEGAPFPSALEALPVRTSAHAVLGALFMSREHVGPRTRVGLRQKTSAPLLEAPRAVPSRQYKQCTPSAPINVNPREPLLPLQLRKFPPVRKLFTLGRYYRSACRK